MPPNFEVSLLQGVFKLNFKWDRHCPWWCDVVGNECFTCPPTFTSSSSFLMYLKSQTGFLLLGLKENVSSPQLLYLHITSLKITHTHTHICMEMETIHSNFFKFMLDFLFYFVHLTVVFLPLRFLHPLTCQFNLYGAPALLCPLPDGVCYSNCVLILRAFVLWHCFMVVDFFFRLPLKPPPQIPQSQLLGGVFLRCEA